jgi:uncharacterized protein YecE (DUF72 family)
MTRAPSQTGCVRVGIGGWDYDPWRETFYPPGLARRSQLDYASRQFTSIEVNSTFYRLQKPETFVKWRESTPKDFMFSLKAPRFIVQRSNLATAQAAVDRFISSGIEELKSKLGPIVWQLAPTKHFDGKELDAFVALLPATAGEVPLRHAIEARHASFMTAEFLDILREHHVAVVYEDDATYPGAADLTSTFVYARLRRSAASVATGYSQDALKRWSRRARTWANGGEPADLPRIAPKATKPALPRDVFIYFIAGAKERNPSAARKLISILGSIGV